MTVANNYGGVCELSLEIIHRNTSDDFRIDKCSGAS